jgi:spoIIIJ-associated protein
VDSKTATSKQWLEKLLLLMGISATVETEGFAKIESDEDSCWLKIELDEDNEQLVDRVIGDRGESIDAIQYLVNTSLNLSLEPELQGSFTVEMAGYRVKRYQELVDLVRETADKVRATGEEIEVPGLSSAERRQIHNLLQDSTDLQTESRGQEPDRRLVVRLVDLSG